MSLPSSVLDAPYPVEVIPSGVQAMLHWTDYLSISHDVLAVIEFFTGFNPLTSLSEWFVGDWRSYGVVTATMTQLQEYVGAVATQLHERADGLQGVWTGHAADAAVTAFDQAGLTVLSLKDPLQRIEQAMRELTLAIDELCGVMEGALEAAIDSAIIMLIEAAAGAALSETVVGALVLWGMAAVEAADLVRNIGMLLKTWSIMMTTVDAFIGVVVGAAGALTDKAVPLSMTPYHHPGVP